MGFTNVRSTDYGDGNFYHLDTDADLTTIQAKSESITPGSLAYSIESGKIWMLDTTHTWQLIYVDTGSENSPEQQESHGHYFYSDKAEMDQAYNDFHLEGHKAGELGFVMEDESHNDAIGVYELQDEGGALKWKYLTSIIPDPDGERNGGPTLYGVYETYAEMLADLANLKAEGYLLNDVGIVLRDEKKDGSMSFYKLDPSQEDDAAFLYQYGLRPSEVINQKGDAPTCVAFAVGQFRKDIFDQSGWITNGGFEKHLELCEDFSDLLIKTTKTNFQGMDIYIYVGNSQEGEDVIGTKITNYDPLVISGIKGASTITVVGGLCKESARTTPIAGDNYGENPAGIWCDQQCQIRGSWSHPVSVKENMSGVINVPFLTVSGSRVNVASAVINAMVTWEGTPTAIQRYALFDINSHAYLTITATTLAFNGLGDNNWTDFSQMPLIQCYGNSTIVVDGGNPVSNDKNGLVLFFVDNTTPIADLNKHIGPIFLITDNSMMYYSAAFCCSQMGVDDAFLDNGSNTDIGPKKYNYHCGIATSNSTIRQQGVYQFTPEFFVGINRENGYVNVPQYSHAGVYNTRIYLRQPPTDCFFIGDYTAPYTENTVLNVYQHARFGYNYNNSYNKNTKKYAAMQFNSWNAFCDVAKYWDFGNETVEIFFGNDLSNAISITSGLLHNVRALHLHGGINEFSSIHSLGYDIGSSSHTIPQTGNPAKSAQDYLTANHGKVRIGGGYSVISIREPEYPVTISGVWVVDYNECSNLFFIDKAKVELRNFCGLYAPQTIESFTGGDFNFLMVKDSTMKIAADSHNVFIFNTTDSWQARMPPVLYLYNSVCYHNSYKTNDAANITIVTQNGDDPLAQLKTEPVRVFTYSKADFCRLTFRYQDSTGNLQLLHNNGSNGLIRMAAGQFIGLAKDYTMEDFVFADKASSICLGKAANAILSYPDVHTAPEAISLL